MDSFCHLFLLVVCQGGCGLKEIMHGWNVQSELWLSLVLTFLQAAWLVIASKVLNYEMHMICTAKIQKKCRRNAVIIWYGKNEDDLQTKLAQWDSIIYKYISCIYYMYSIYLKIICWGVLNILYVQNEYEIILHNETSFS